MKLKRVTRDAYQGKLVRITYCWAKTTLYSEIIPDSIHVIIKPPFGAMNSDCGVWIKGKEGIPVRIMSDEFVYHKLKRL